MMADVTGPISTLPGSYHDPQGNVCDNHSDRKAVVRIQGETDSFGSEMYDFCEECKAEYLAELKDADTSGYCSWCQKDAPKLVNVRCYDEGSSGPVYLVCEACSDAEHKRMREDLEDLGYYDDFD